MSLQRSLGAAGRLAGGIAMGTAFAGAGLIALAGLTGPLTGPEPAARFDLTVVAPPQVDAALPAYAPADDPQTTVRPFGLIGHFVPPYLALLAAPTGSIAGSMVVPDGAAQPKLAPPAGLPGPAPDTLLGAEPGAAPAVDESPANAGRTAALAAPARPAADPAGVPTTVAAAARAYEPAPAGPLHFLQGGYFAERGNALALSAQLAEAGLPVHVEQTANRAGAPRWLVLVGPYPQARDALGARAAAPDLLAEAYAVQRRD